MSIYTLTASLDTDTGGAARPGGWIDAGLFHVRPPSTDYTYDYGSAVTVNHIQAIPFAGYQFWKWTGDYPAGYQYESMFNIYVDGGKDITAWFKPILNVTVVGDAGTVTSDVGGINSPGISESAAFEFDTVVTLTTNAPTGYAFDHWEGDASGSTDPLAVTMSTKKDITAVFKKIWDLTLTVTPDTSYGAVTDDLSGIDCPGDCAETYNDGTDVELTATPDDGYYFVQWTGDLTGSTNPVTVTMDGDYDITAVFAPCTLDVSISPTGGGSVASTDTNIACPATACTYDYTVDTSVELTATENAGYYFKQWQGDVTGTDNPITFSMDEAKSVVAVFGEYVDLDVSITGTGTVTGGTIDCPGTCSQVDIESGTPITLTAEPGVGFVFSHWSGDIGGRSNPYTITMNADKAVTAVFIQPQTLTVTVSPSNAGLVSGPDFSISEYVSKEYASGASISLTAQSKTELYVFDHWEGDLSGSTNPETFTLSADMDVVAVFVQPEFDIEVSIEPAGVGTVTGGLTIDCPDTNCTETVTAGDVVTLTATATDPDYIFYMWEGDLDGNDNPKTITIDSYINAIAVFLKPDHWLEKRLSPKKYDTQRWIELARAIEYFWYYYFDPALRKLQDLRSVYTASRESTKKIIRELGAFFEANLPQKNLPIYLSQRKIELLNKETAATVKNALDRVNPDVTVTWEELWASKTDDYGEGFYMDTEVDTTSGDYFKTSRGLLLINGNIFPPESVESWAKIFNLLKPAHIVWNGVVKSHYAALDAGADLEILPSYRPIRLDGEWLVCDVDATELTADSLEVSWGIIESTAITLGETITGIPHLNEGIVAYYVFELTATKDVKITITRSYANVAMFIKWDETIPTPEYYDCSRVEITDLGYCSYYSLPAGIYYIAVEGQAGFDTGYEPADLEWDLKLEEIV